ncbi:MAG: M6 family metalloprotease domain-containing protein [Jiangellales bacterium]
MGTLSRQPLDVDSVLKILAQQESQRCMVAPSPELSERIKSEVSKLQSSKRIRELAPQVRIGLPRRPGLNDGLIIPGSHFPLGTSVDQVRSAAADRSPLHGTLRVIVVLVDFSDREMEQTQDHFDDLFFSTGVVPGGSVREYFDEVTNGLVTLTGQVVGPYRMPRTMAAYANGASGTGSAAPNARTMARDAVLAADPHVNFGPYDNDSNGFVDAFVVVHAGQGAEMTGSTGDIWSHKWVLSGGAYSTDGTQVYGYLTVPEDSRIGVCAHELGHLLFGFPDLYDTDNTSEGVGNWCLMAGGSWNGGGDTPAHPSAWCKVQQAWVTVANVTANGPITVADVKDAHRVFRLWKDGTSGQEYFLLENRQRTRFDAALPGEGLLIWHLDDAIADNSDETHYRVALEQADGLAHLESSANRGDAGDTFPGSSDNRAFTNTSTPSSKSYGGVSTCVSVTAISDSGPVMTAQVTVACGKSTLKDAKDGKDTGKDRKDKDVKDRVKDVKELRKEAGKDVGDKALVRDKRPEKPVTDKSVAYDKNWDAKLTDAKYPDGKLTDGWDWRSPEAPGADGGLGALQARLEALEAAVFGAVEPFIGDDLRPDLRDSALSAEPGAGTSVDLTDKRDFDSPFGA